MLVSTHRKIDSHETFRFGTVRTIVAWRAISNSTTVVILVASHLDIFTRHANFPTCGTTGRAFEPCHGLEEGNCNNCAEDWEHFHCGAIKLGLRLECAEGIGVLTWVYVSVFLVDCLWGPGVGHIAFIAGLKWKYNFLQHISNHQVPSPGLARCQWGSQVKIWKIKLEAEAINVISEFCFQTRGWNSVQRTPPSCIMIESCRWITLLRDYISGS